MELLDLALMHRFRLKPGTGVKRPRRLLQKLLLPRVNLVRVNFVSLRQVCDRRLFPNRL